MNERLIAPRQRPTPAQAPRDWPTYGQRCELARIRARHGPVELYRGLDDSLVVTIPDRPRAIVVRP